MSDLTEQVEIQAKSADRYGDSTVVPVSLARELATKIDSLTTALHDAINSPKGVVPDSAAEFYDPERVK